MRICSFSSGYADFRSGFAIFTARNVVAQGNVLHVSVILFTGGGIWQTPPIQADTPPGRHPLAGRHPPGRHHLGRYPYSPRQTPPYPSPHPSRNPRDGHCSGWYASYWNAFLFCDGFAIFWLFSVSTSSQVAYLTYLKIANLPEKLQNQHYRS